ncbi:hypothetical protein [Saccharolobus islandicus]|uniref:Uncharacterized protein n=5 Tax=Saccharolobus islandicus TaxID=43080 RepID=C3MLM4_SACI2|nr:hypothetical protein [Sulfolobus islandicus]ACP34622.1 conserved hypothetical protein [Sulfolobus islandicus L.S.2.15]ACP37285.1 conserved hypothetical protein [Sulfolobus islandicus M.14.25]ACP54442.1 conserved hypothetical protein [Sulfolobus islandicus M.16.27]ACR41085.1 conserved hypothetical protein [Sulfolobus islandicus M.16.4]ADB86275.1 conserved hypothetical protein [Sulfolobus islandicus L.D.8.5]
MRSILKIMVGLAMLSGAIGLDYIGASFQSLSVLVVSMILAIAGTMVGIRGLMEFLGERF